MQIGITNQIIHKIKLPRISGEVVYKLVSDLHFVREDVTVLELNEALQKNEAVEAVGVIGLDGSTLGLIVRSELFNSLSRRFGLEVLGKSVVRDVMCEATVFRCERNLYSVAEELSEDLKGGRDQYYLLIDEQGRFSGIFKTRDLLIYLSNQTTKDIAMARSLQSHIVRRSLELSDVGYRMVMTSHMAKGLGGDFTYTEKGSSGMFFVLADVSGKGVTASLVTVALWGFFKMKRKLGHLSKMLSRLNTYLIETFDAEKFLTGLFCLYDSSSRLLKFCDMGHSYIYLFRKGSLSLIKHKQENPPVGIIPEIHPDVSRVSLESGDILVLFTDGLIEQTNMRKEIYPVKRVERILQKQSSEDIQQKASTINDDFHRFRGHQAQHDDVSLCLMEILPGDPEKAE